MDDITIPATENTDATIQTTIQETVVVDTPLPSETVDEVIPTQEELLAAYKELKASQTKAPETVPTTASTDIFKDLSDRVLNETIDDAYYAEMELKGYSKDFIDTYANGVKTKQVEAFKETIKDFGTLDDYAGAIAYAQTFWTAEEITSYNNAIAKADSDTIKVLAGRLIKESKSASNKVPENAPITTIKQATVEGVKGYETISDFQKDMNTRAYKTDATYRAKVEAKLAVTTAF